MNVSAIFATLSRFFEPSPGFGDGSAATRPIRPQVGSFAALDYFKIGEILNAAQGAKDDLKRQLSQRLETAT